MHQLNKELKTSDRGDRGARQNSWPGDASFRWGLALITIAALLIRVAAAFYWETKVPPGQQFVWGDSSTYWEIAENLVGSGQYEFGEPVQRIFRAPGYCLFLAALMKSSLLLTSKPLTVMSARLAGCVLGALSVTLIGLWTAKLSEQKFPALIAAFLAAVYPGAIAMSIFVLSESLFIPIMILSLWTWSHAFNRNHLLAACGWALLTGLLTGDAILVRPSWLLFAPLGTMVLLVFYKNRLRQIAIATCIGIGIALAMAPWWYRNYQISGQFIPTTLQVGASLYDGWNAHADGSSDMTHGYAEVKAWQHDERRLREKELYESPARRIRPQTSDSTGDRQATAQSDAMPIAARGENSNNGPIDHAMLLELQSNQRLRDQAIQWGTRHPGTLFQLFFVKVGRTWRPWPAANEIGSLTLTIITVIGFLPIFGLALRSLPFLLRQNISWCICFLPAIYFTALHGIFVGSIRYRQPAVMLLTIFAAMTVLNLLNLKAKKSAHSKN